MRTGTAAADLHAVDADALGYIIQSVVWVRTFHICVLENVLQNFCNRWTRRRPRMENTVHRVHKISIQFTISIIVGCVFTFWAAEEGHTVLHQMMKFTSHRQKQPRGCRTHELAFSCAILWDSWLKLSHNMAHDRWDHDYFRSTTVFSYHILQYFTSCASIFSFPNWNKMVKHISFLSTNCQDCVLLVLLLSISCSISWK